VRGAVPVVLDAGKGLLDELAKVGLVDVSLEASPAALVQVVPVDAVLADRPTLAEPVVVPQPATHTAHRRG
jgi:hypothetical protein